MEQIAPRSLYFKIYAALMALLAATVAANYVNLGPFNIVVALAIAIAKAVLVILYFMHVRWSPRLIWIYAALGFFWTMHLIGGTLAEVLTRPGGPSG